MERTVHQSIAEGLALIFQGIARLQTAYPHKKFTIDGRLVGDIGEIIAALEYDVILDEKLMRDYDGHTPAGQKVQIKATFKNSLTFVKVPDYYLGLKLHEDGSYDEIFNGPGQIIYEHYRGWKGIGTKLLSFPIRKLQALSLEINDQERIPKRPPITLPPQT